MRLTRQSRDGSRRDRDSGQSLQVSASTYEVAFLVEEYLCQRRVGDRVEIVVTTLTPTNLPVASRRVSGMMSRALASRGIELRIRHVVETFDCDACTVAVANSSTLDFSMALAALQARPPPVVVGSLFVGEGDWI